MRRLFWTAVLPVLCSCSAVETFATKAWVTHLGKMTNWVQADAEALKYKDEEPQARAYLANLRALSSVRAVSIKMRDDGFHWRREALDFISYPWVTIARKRGDCDDFVALWESVLKYKEGETKKVYVSSPENAHAMLLYRTGRTLYLLSNLDVWAVGDPGEEEELARAYYGDKTKTVVIY
jgi:predicted transglutaminase-like cysteine proteinase